MVWNLQLIAKAAVRLRPSETSFVREAETLPAWHILPYFRADHGIFIHKEHIHADRSEATCFLKSQARDKNQGLGIIAAAKNVIDPGVEPALSI
jgi:hypothetical protein